MKPTRLTNWQLIALSGPTLPFAAFSVVEKMLLPAFLESHVGLNLALIGALLLATRLLDIIADNLAGTLSDVQLLTGVGRRKYWFVAGLPIALLSTVLLFSAEPGVAWPVIGAFLWLASTGWTISNASHGAWALEAGTNLADRSRIFAGRTTAAIVGFLILTGCLLLTDTGLDRQLIVSNVIIVVAVGLSTLAAVVLVPDRPLKSRRASGPRFMDGLVFAFSSPSRRRLALIFALVGANSAVSAGSFVFLARDGLGVAGLIPLALFLQSLATIAGLGPVLLAVKRLSPVLILRWVFGLNILLSLGIFLLPTLPPTGFLIWVCLRGSMSAIDFTLLRALAGQELDLTGKASKPADAGVVYASFHLPFNLAAALVTGGYFVALERLGGQAALTVALGHPTVWLTAGLGSLFSLVSFFASERLGGRNN